MDKPKSSSLDTNEILKKLNGSTDTNNKVQPKDKVIKVNVKCGHHHKDSSSDKCRKCNRCNKWKCSSSSSSSSSLDCQCHSSSSSSLYCRCHSSSSSSLYCHCHSSSSSSSCDSSSSSSSLCDRSPSQKIYGYQYKWGRRGLYLTNRVYVCRQCKCGKLQCKSKKLKSRKTFIFTKRPNCSSSSLSSTSSSCCGNYYRYQYRPWSCRFQRWSY
jgi:hypothetical protein